MELVEDSVSQERKQQEQKPKCTKALCKASSQVGHSCDYINSPQVSGQQGEDCSSQSPRPITHHRYLCAATPLGLTKSFLDVSGYH